MSLPTLRALWVAEQLVARGQDGQEQAVALMRDVGMLAGTVQGMERHGRRYLVLANQESVERFEGARRAGLTVLGRLAAADRALAAAVGDGLALLEGLDGRVLQEGKADDIRAQLGRMGLIQADLLETARQVVARGSAQRQAALERHRRELVWSLGALALMALGAGLVLSRWLEQPFLRLGGGVEQLTRGELDEPIAISGPRDARRLARQLDGLRARLHTLENERARVLSHMAHELKTPLACLGEGVAQLAEGLAGPLSESQGRLLPVLQRGVADLHRRIDDLMALSQASYRIRHLVRSRVDLRIIAREAVAALALQAQARGVRLEVEGKALLQADPDLLRMVLTNLLSNALAFSPTGGRVSLNLRRRGPRVEVLCVDQGPGVAPGEGERIFEPFFRGSRQPSREAGGSGVGLAMVREAVEAHGGRIGLLSEGPGARFQVELPHGV